MAAAGNDPTAAEWQERGRHVGVVACAFLMFEAALTRSLTTG